MGKLYSCSFQVAATVVSVHTGGVFKKNAISPQMVYEKFFSGTGDL
jgi:hypothetical protein